MWAAARRRRHALTALARVAGPHPNGGRWAWEVDGPGGRLDGHEATEAEAWGTARRRAVGVLGRLEAPNGGGQLRAALGGET